MRRWHILLLVLATGILPLTSVASATQREEAARGDHGYPVWSRDGRRIAFESNWQVWVMNADGSGPRNLTRAAGNRESQPAWSPTQK